ncbi:hypothetical protein [Opitutus sp. ER46]|uniref:hypothetical protein n=1 Tax=Opitutus sp. ER46 TaxID=2161864 RepID=UPI000D30581B|nr:hypothetical protein [Opitutus sp. ER46]PTX92584.1 hypothetical protein DB354_14750 [Opitutus sp. ER46]
MKFLSAASLLVAAFVALLFAVPFSPAAKETPDAFAIEVQLRSTSAGRVQIYPDAGTGFTEASSLIQALTPGAGFTTYRFPIPPGRYRQFRFDPVDGDTAVTLKSLRVVRVDGRVVRDVALNALQPAYAIRELRPTADGLEIFPAPNANDPQLTVAFDPPLQLEPSRLALVVGGWRPAVACFAVLLLLLVALDRLPRVRDALASRARRLAARPVLALSLVAALAVAASSYPVVFLGKSYVSPNMGTVLLYEEFPTLPGYRDATAGEVKGSDLGAIMWQHIPLSMVEARALRQGEVPLWNRYNTGGTPLLGQGQSMFGDPLHLLVLATNGRSWAWDLKFLLAKWIFASGLGLIVFTLVRTNGTRTGSAGAPPATEAGDHFSTSLLPALVVAAAAPFVGFFLYRFNHPAFFSLCYAPWPLYCWLRVTAARRVRGAAGWTAGLVVANLALMNSGTAKEAYMLLLAMNLAGAAVLLADAAPWRQRLLKLAGTAWAGLLFVLLTAPIWGTFLHELANAYTSYNSAAAYQIQPSIILGLFDEAFYRPIAPNNQTFSPSLNFLLLLGFLYFLATLRAHFGARRVMAIAAVSLLPLALAFGLVPPAWIMGLPFLANIAHIDNTFSCVLIVLWSVLAGVGFAAAMRRLPTREGRGDLLIAGLLLGAIVFAWIAFRQAVHRPMYGTAFTVNDLGRPLAVAPFLWGYLASLLLAVVVFAAGVRHASVTRRLTPALTLLLAASAGALVWRHALHAPAAGFESFVLRPTTRVDFHAKSEAVQLMQAAVAREPARAYGIRGVFFPGWNDVYGLETIHGPDALMNPWYRELTGLLGGAQRLWDWRIYLEPPNVPAARPFFDALNVRFYLDRHSDQGLMGRALKLTKIADLDVYESPTVWPRAFFTDRVAPYDRAEEFAEKIRTGDGRPFAAMARKDLAATPTLAALWGDWAGRRVVPATHYRLTENTTAFDVHAPGPGAVVLLETFWAGDFRVFVNGRKQPILRLNHAFKGVALPAGGDYRIEFRCVPRHWYRNVAFSIVGAVLFLASLAAAWRWPAGNGSARRDAATA